MPQPIQTMPEGWIFQAIWKHHAEARAKVCVPDTVLIKDGAPYRWLFTSRQGEVVRKRALDLVAVRDRFSKISLVHKNNEQRLVAAVRERGQSAYDPSKIAPRHLDSETFTEFMSSRLAQSGNSVVALQAFVPSRGEAGTAFHNTYEAHPTEPRGRPVTTTHRLRYWKSGGRHDGGATTVGSVGEEKSKQFDDTDTSAVMAPVRVRDQRLCSDFDATTLAIVKYVERQHRVRVRTMSCEYVVDEDHRIWFTWGWNVTAQKNSKKKGVDGAEGLVQIGSDDEQQQERMAQTKTKARSKHSYTAGSKEALRAEKMLGSAVERVETGLGGGSSSAAPRHMRRAGGTGQGGGSGFGIKRTGQTSPRGTPGPNQCTGDFCDFVVNDPEVLKAEEKEQPGQKRGYGGAKDLFSPSEMARLAQRLGSDGAMDDMLSGNKDSQTPTATNVILFKSVALARKERRGMAASDEGVTSFSKFGASQGGSEILNPEEQQHGLDVILATGAPQRESVETRFTDAHRMKVERVKARQMGMDGGAANYYKSVRVCSTCYCVYSTLDAARDILKMQQEASAISLPRTSTRIVGGRMMGDGGSSLLSIHDQSHGHGGPSMEDVSAFESSVRSKAHTFGASRRATSRAAQAKSQAAARRRQMNRDNSAMPGGGGGRSIGGGQRRQLQQQQQNNTSSVLLPNIQQSQYGVDGPRSPPNEEERRQRVSNMPWKDKQRNEMDNNPKKALAERRRQREMTRGGHEMDRFQSLEEYVRKSAPDELRDDESSIPDDASITDEQLDAMDAEAAGSNDVGRILLLDEEPPTRNHASDTLRKHGFEVDVAADGTRGLAMFKANASSYDAVLASRSLPGIDGVELTKIVRRLEQKEQAALDEKNEAKAYRSGRRSPKQTEVRRVPIIAFTEMASQEDLRLYMEVGMDGCVSKPLNEQALLATMTAAIPHHRVIADGGGGGGSGGGGGRGSPGQSRTVNDQQYGVPQGENGSVVQFRPATTRLAMVSSQSIVEKSLKMPVQVTANVTGGIFQMDADTAIPYTVLGEAHPGSRLFNFVVCHDLFDTCENAQIFFRPLVSKYPGMQVLVWNYPGQAFSEWRRDVTLNNKYLAGCLDSLLRHVGVQGTSEFRTDGAPFYLLGFGLGGNVGKLFIFRLCFICLLTISRN